MVLIILPIRNESGNILETANRLRQYIKDDNEVLFIDDGSTDGTYERLYLFNHERFRTIKNRFDNGKGSALKTAFIMSEFMYRLDSDDLICFLDGDGQIDPSEIDTFQIIMKTYGADVVIGNKRHTYSSAKYTLFRRIVSGTYNLIIRTLFDFKYQDTQCGIKLFKKSALEKVIEKVNTKRYAFDLELITALRDNDFRIADAPVNLSEQMNRGSISVRSIINTFCDTLIIWFKKMKGDYKCQK